MHGLHSASASNPLWVSALMYGQTPRGQRLRSERVGPAWTRAAHLRRTARLSSSCPVELLRPCRLSLTSLWGENSAQYVERSEEVWPHVLNSRSLIALPAGEGTPDPWHRRGDKGGVGRWPGQRPHLGPPVGPSPECAALRAVLRASPAAWLERNEEGRHGLVSCVWRGKRSWSAWVCL